jgi:hypothetical protein
MPLSQLAISSTNQKCIDMLKEKRKNYFEKEKDIAIFAAIYAISKVDLTKYSPLDKYTPEGGYSENKWHLQDVDADNFIRESLSLFYDNYEDQDFALRSIVSLGLDAIYDLIKNKENWDISDLL